MCEIARALCCWCLWTAGVSKDGQNVEPGFVGVSCVKLCRQLVFWSFAMKLRFLWWYKLCDFTLFHSWVLNNENQCRCFSFFLSDVFKAALSKKKDLMSVNTLLSGWANFGSKNEPNSSSQQRFTSFRLIIEMMAERGIFLIPTAHSNVGTSSACGVPQVVGEAEYKATQKVEFPEIS